MGGMTREIIKRGGRLPTLNHLKGGAGGGAGGARGNILRKPPGNTVGDRGTVCES